MSASDNTKSSSNIIGLGGLIKETESSSAADSTSYKAPPIKGRGYGGGMKATKAVPGKGKPVKRTSGKGNGKTPIVPIIPVRPTKPKKP
tara:strand:- start:339 stop:605 length:267 start_codon:yes stop_codon:yes gene_type:complete